jgi:hypothetical protein
MTKNELIQNRRAQLMGLSTEDLVVTIGEYFDKHATMPGQKDLKAAAERIVANIVENPGFDIDPNAKAQMAAKFADIVVREMKVEKVQVQNVNKSNKDDASVLKPTDLKLVEIASVPAEGTSPAKKVYSVEGRIQDGKVVVDGYEVGSLKSGFVTNNPGTSCPATVIATDYSNGKFANMSYTVVADIAA